MKRLFTLTAALLCGVMVFAQANLTTNTLAKGNAQREKLAQLKKVQSQKMRDAAWSCDFETGSPSFTVTNAVACDAQFQWQNAYYEADYDYDTDKRLYVPLNYPENINSDTPETWAICDLWNGNQNQGLLDQVDVDTYMVFEGIDLSSVDRPVVSWIQLRRFFNIPPSLKGTTLEVSVDGGAHWTEHVIEYGSATEYSMNYASVAITEAANLDDVIIRFRVHRYDADIYDTYGIHYDRSYFNIMWALDDITIVDAPEYDLVLKDYRMSNTYGALYYLFSGIANHYHVIPMEGQSPKAEWENGLYASFNAIVKQEGYAEVTPKLNITITNPNGVEIYNDDIEGIELGFFETDTIDFIEYDATFATTGKVFQFEEGQEVIPGMYTVTYTVSADGYTDPTPNNNTASHPFWITEDTYCIATPEIGTKTMGPNTWSDFDDGDAIGASYTYRVLPEDKMSVDLFIGANSSVDTAAFCIKLFEYGTDDWVLVNQGLVTTITSDMLGKWNNFEFIDEYTMEFGEDETSKEVLIGVEFYENGGELSLGASTQMPNFGWICKYYLDDEDGWVSINATQSSNAPAIAFTSRQGEWVNAATVVANDIEMYPNPTTGIVNLTNVENASVEVYNMVGQMVASMNCNSTNASIDLSNVANGNYIVRIVKDGEVSTSKLNIVK